MDDDNIGEVFRAQDQEQQDRDNGATGGQRRQSGKETLLLGQNIRPTYKPTLFYIVLFVQRIKHWTWSHLSFMAQMYNLSLAWDMCQLQSFFDVSRWNVYYCFCTTQDTLANTKHPTIPRCPVRASPCPDGGAVRRRSSQLEQGEHSTPPPGSGFQWVDQIYDALLQSKARIAPLYRL